ncbi:MAG: efflux RND transporter periplasmic adaptor subunit [Thermomonas sp.]|nr:efflux RND transporter periplasmic adaptor subunit [Thermomonas sp.]MDI1253330.1 efflux RND transporter periplasmic adaptor subunit [Thermomonas sp.]
MPAAGASSDKPVLYWYDPMQPDKHFDKPGKSPFMDMQLVPKYAEAGAPAKREPLYWYDPMQPDKHFDKPGKSPFMDMQLVGKYPEAPQADAANTGGMKVSAASQQNLGMRTAIVEMGSLSSGAHVPGSVAWDQRATYAVSARVDGVIEILHVRAPFEHVRKGQALAELIAPEWNAAAQEYLALGRAGSADARALQGAARNRLRVLGMDEGQIRSLRGSGVRVVLRAPRDGVVSQLDVREGQRVQAGMMLMTINGLDTVWVEAAIPQAQAAGIVPGTKVTASVSAFPGEIFDGKVEALLPNIDAGNRTQMARIVLANPGQKLAPGMFADLQFAGTSGGSHPLLPDEALIATGSDARVIVAMGEGRFQPVRVTTGRSAGGRTEVLSGLSGGERVVVSGQFLLDSEASLSGALDRLSTDATATPDPRAGDAMDAMPAKPAQPAKADKPDPHAGHDMGAMPPEPRP